MATTSDAAAMRGVALCFAAEILEGTARGFDPDDEGQDSIFVVRTQGVLSAWRDACPHINGAPMAWRKDRYLNAEATRIVCHAHGAEFLPEDGLCVQGPCAGRRLTAVSIEVDESGELRAHLEKT
jgi:nitrite reductase/ring-hydroxylating ferredoxin subunit